MLINILGNYRGQFEDCFGNFDLFLERKLARPSVDCQFLITDIEADKKYDS